VNGTIRITNCWPLLSRLIMWPEDRMTRHTAGPQHRHLTVTGTTTSGSPMLAASNKLAAGNEDGTLYILLLSSNPVITNHTFEGVGLTEGYMNYHALTTSNRTPHCTPHHRSSYTTCFLMHARPQSLTDQCTPVDMPIRLHTIVQARRRLETLHSREQLITATITPLTKK
jgi:hypothetical protein